MSEDRTIIVRIDAMLGQLSSSTSSLNPKIFKVSRPLRQVNEEAYDPVLVAIGPIHHSTTNLQNMEKYKKMFLKQLLARREETSVERYVVELKMLDTNARQFYENSIQVPEGDTFIEMLLLDGIFVIELLRRTASRGLRGDDDNIFKFTQVINQLQHDLLLVENQLPFFVLEKLFEMTMTANPPDDLQHLFLEMIRGYVPWMRPINGSRIHQYDIDDHLAGLFYKINFSNDNERLMPNHFDMDEIKTISELNEAGIKFKPTQDCTNWTEASFKDGVLYLPLLRLFDRTESVLRNLIAYEQMLPSECPRFMANYSALMQSLIHSAKDVEILRRAGVIGTWLGDDETAHLMINKLGKNIMMNENFSYLAVIQEVNEYCSRRRQKYKVILKNNYCGSPCAIVSITAAISLLILTLLQTVFTGISTFDHHVLEVKIVH